MRNKAIMRATKLCNSAQTALVRLFCVNEDGKETLITTSSPIPRVAVARVCQLLEQLLTVAPSIESLKGVIRIPGRTAWASATAPDAESAALQARLQHDMHTAQGALVLITLSSDCPIVASMKSAMNVIHRETPKIAATALLIAHDETLRAQVRVEILLTGMGKSAGRMAYSRISRHLQDL